LSSIIFETARFLFCAKEIVHLDESGSIDAGIPDVISVDAFEELLSKASAAIDAGDYSSALEGFRQALDMARRVYGENAELRELENTIKDIGSILP